MHNVCENIILYISGYLKEHNRFAEAAVVLVDYAYVGCYYYSLVRFAL